MLSSVLFIRSMNRSLVRKRYTGDALPSRRIYAAVDEARLLALRSRATVLELKGTLFFGTGDRVAHLPTNWTRVATRWCWTSGA